MKKLPETGKAYLFTSEKGITTFRVMDVNKVTGCIYLVAECSQEKAKELLAHTVKNKHGEEISVPRLAWMPKENCWAVNVEWDVWQGMVGPLYEDRVTELSRFTECLIEYHGDAQLRAWSKDITDANRKLRLKMALLEGENSPYVEGYSVDSVLKKIDKTPPPYVETESRAGVALFDIHHRPKP